MKLTISQKPHLVERQWFVVDATDLPLGRISSEIAKVLRGKTKAELLLTLIVVITLSLLMLIKFV